VHVFLESAARIPSADSGVFSGRVAIGVIAVSADGLLAFPVGL
jgi:hypothetical protein